MMCVCVHLGQEIVRIIFLFAIFPSFNSFRLPEKSVKHISIAGRFVSLASFSSPFSLPSLIIYSYVIAFAPDHQ